MNYQLIERLDDARKLLYVHGMLSEQENGRAKQRIEKMAARAEQLDGLPSADEEQADG